MPLPAGHLCTCTEYITRHCRWCLQATKSFPKDIAAKVRTDESLVPKGDKKAMQRVMPFLQWVVNEVKLQGPDAMQLTMSFDEVGVLTDNLAFMAATLNVPEVTVVTTSEA